MKNRMEGVDERTVRPARSAITTDDESVKNSSLCELPQEADDEHKLETLIQERMQILPQNMSKIVNDIYFKFFI